MTASRLGWRLTVAALLSGLVWALPVPPAVRAADPLLVVNQVLVDRFPEVAAFFTVVDDAGLPITDIAKERLQVLHNGRPVPDVSLELADSQQEGLAAVLAIDVSGSMQGRPLQAAKLAARVFLGRMGPLDRGALIAFEDRVTVLQDLTNDRAALDSAVEKLVAKGDTAFYDAVFQGVSLVARQPLGRRSVVLITDGEDTKSSLTLDDAITKARENNTPVSVIGLGQVKSDPLRRLTMITGGSYGETLDPDRLSERIGQVSDLLRKQYVLRYQAPDSRPPENEVEIVLNQGGRQLRAAQRFPAPPMAPLAISLAEPPAGSRVSGFVELRPTIANGQRVDRVEYLVDGTTIGTVTQEPYGLTWDTSRLSQGEHTLTVKARLGSQEAQQSIPLVIGSPVQVSITLPNGPELSGPVTLMPQVSGSAPTSNVVWSVDGQPVGNATQPPFAFEWDTSSVPPGEHTVAAEAHDQAGNVGRASQTVTVKPPAAAAQPPAAAPEASAPPAQPPAQAAAPATQDPAQPAPGAQQAAAQPAQPAANTPAVAPTPATNATPVSGTPAPKTGATATATPSGTSQPVRDRIMETLDKPAVAVPLAVIASGLVVGGLLFLLLRRRERPAAPGIRARSLGPGNASYPGSAAPGTSGGGHSSYPGSVPPVTPASGGGHSSYPGSASPGTIGSGHSSYPGSAPPGATVGGQSSYPGSASSGTVITGPLGGTPPPAVNPATMVGFESGGSFPGPGTVRSTPSDPGFGQPPGPPSNPGMASVTVTSPERGAQTFTLGTEHVIGRVAGPGVILVPDPQASRRHARITYEGGQFVYHDLGATNPTRRDGKPVPATFVLTNGDRLRIGHSELVFRL